MSSAASREAKAMDKAAREREEVRKKTMFLEECRRANQKKKEAVEAARRRKRDLQRKEMEAWRRREEEIQAKQKHTKMKRVKAQVGKGAQDAEEGDMKRQGRAMVSALLSQVLAAHSNLRTAALPNSTTMWVVEKVFQKVCRTDLIIEEPP